MCVCVCVCVWEGGGGGGGVVAVLGCSRVYDTASDQLKWGPEIVPVRLLSSAVKNAKFGGCHQSVGSCPSNWFAARHSVKM